MITQQKTGNISDRSGSAHRNLRAIDALQLCDAPIKDVPKPVDSEVETGIDYSRVIDIWHKTRIDDQEGTHEVQGALSCQVAPYG